MPSPGVGRRTPYAFRRTCRANRRHTGSARYDVIGSSDAKPRIDSSQGGGTQQRGCARGGLGEGLARWGRRGGLEGFVGERQGRGTKGLVEVQREPTTGGYLRAPCPVLNRNMFYRG
eukprot:381209-Prorocentrum_minimum.AAC.1